MAAVLAWLSEFQHTAARRRLGHKGQFSDGLESFNTQPPEGGWINTDSASEFTYVSTHSSPKAAGTSTFFSLYGLNGFNTQPPEGGWLPCYPQFFLTTNVSTHSRPKAAGNWVASASTPAAGFNTQPPEGGWAS